MSGHVVYLENRPETIQGQLRITKKYRLQNNICLRPQQLGDLLESAALKGDGIKAFVLDMHDTEVQSLAEIDLPNVDTSKGETVGIVVAEKYLKAPGSRFGHIPIVFLTAYKIHAPVKKRIELLRERGNDIVDIGKNDLSTFDDFIRKLVEPNKRVRRREAPKRKTEPIRVAQLERTIHTSAVDAPLFEAVRGRIRYKQAPASDQILQRKAAVRERFVEVARLCLSRENEQPELKRLSDRYRQDLRALRKGRGAYRLHLTGIDLETFVRTKLSTPSDPERNPPLDADLLHAIQSLLVAHAGLMSIFPDVIRLAEELDRYRGQFEPIDALRSRVLEPVIERLALSRGLLDEETKELTRGVSELQKAAIGTTPTRAVVTTKHGWLRGVLAAIGQYVLDQAKAITEVARDSAIKEAVSQGLSDPKKLFWAATGFLAAAQTFLVHLADALPISFGWIPHLLKWLSLI